MKSNTCSLPFDFIGRSSEDTEVDEIVQMVQADQGWAEGLLNFLKARQAWTKKLTELGPHRWSAKSFSELFPED